MWRSIGLALLVATVCLTFLPGAPNAQRAFWDVVTHASRAALPGFTTIEGSSLVLIERTRSVTTDGDGRYTIVDLRPFTYKLTFGLAGFSTAVHEEVEPPGNRRAPIKGRKPRPLVSTTNQRGRVYGGSFWNARGPSHAL